MDLIRIGIAMVGVLALALAWIWMFSHRKPRSENKANSIMILEISGTNLPLSEDALARVRNELIAVAEAQDMQIDDIHVQNSAKGLKVELTGMGGSILSFDGLATEMRKLIEVMHERAAR